MSKITSMKILTRSARKFYNNFYDPKLDKSEKLHTGRKIFIVFLHNISENMEKYA